MGAEQAFDLIIKVVCYPPIKARFKKSFITPHDVLNSRCDEFEKKQEALGAGVLALLHDRVYQACKKYIDQDSISIEDMKNLEHLYDAYAGMGELFERVCDLEFE